MYLPHIKRRPNRAMLLDRFCNFLALRFVLTMEFCFWDPTDASAMSTRWYLNK